MKTFTEPQNEHNIVKKSTAFTNVHAIFFFYTKVKKLELELEGAKQKFKEMSDSYKKEIEDKKISEENLLGEVGKLSMCENLLY